MAPSINVVTITWQDGHANWRRAGSILPTSGAFAMVAFNGATNHGWTPPFWDPNAPGKWRTVSYGVTAVTKQVVGAMGFNHFVGVRIDNNHLDEWTRVDSWVGPWNWDLGPGVMHPNPPRRDAQHLAQQRMPPAILEPDMLHTPLYKVIELDCAGWLAATSASSTPPEVLGPIHIERDGTRSLRMPNNAPNAYGPCVYTFRSGIVRASGTRADCVAYIAANPLP